MNNNNNKTPQIGDDMIEEILNIINNYKMKSLSNGNVITNNIFFNNFIRLYYKCFTTNTNNTIKFYDKTVKLNVLDRRDDYMSCVTNMNLVNSSISMSETNTPENTISASSYVFNIKEPQNLPITGYSEDYFIRFIIVREKYPNNPNLGAVLSDVLYLRDDSTNTDVDPDAFITCPSNYFKSDNYQIIGDKTIYMSTETPNKIETIAINFLSEAKLVYSQNKLGPQSAVFGNIYICAIKHTIKSIINITPQDSIRFKGLTSKEIFNRKVKLLDEFNLSNDYPSISVDVKHIIS